MLDAEIRDWLAGNRPAGLDTSVAIRAGLETEVRERPVVIITEVEGSKPHPKVSRGVVTIELLVAPDEADSKANGRAWHEAVVGGLDVDAISSQLTTNKGLKVMFWKPGEASESTEGERGWRYAQTFEVWLTGC